MSPFVPLSAAVEIPSYFVGWFVMDKLGRRWVLFTTMLIGGLACISVIFIPLGIYHAVYSLCITRKNAAFGRLTLVLHWRTGGWTGEQTNRHTYSYYNIDVIIARPGPYNVFNNFFTLGNILKFKTPTPTWWTVRWPWLILLVLRRRPLVDRDAGH